MYYGVCHLKIMNVASLTPCPSLNSYSGIYSCCLVSFSFVSLMWFKSITFIIGFIYKSHPTASNRFLLEKCFVLSDNRIHENWFASMLLCFSILCHTLCYICWGQRGQCSCVCLLLLSLCHLFICPLTSLTILSKPGCMYPLERPLFHSLSTPLSLIFSSRLR